MWAFYMVSGLGPTLGPFEVSSLVTAFFFQTGGMLGVQETCISF